MRQRLPILDRAALEAMPTDSLLSRLRRLLACEESLSASDRSGEEDRQAPVIEFKDSAERTAAHRELKEVLAHRENLPNAQERRDKRMTRAASNRTKEKRR